MNRSRIGLLLLAVVALAALAAGASGGWAATRALSRAVADTGQSVEAMETEAQLPPLPPRFTSVGRSELPINKQARRISPGLLRFQNRLLLQPISLRRRDIGYGRQVLLEVLAPARAGLLSQIVPPQPFFAPKGPPTVAQVVRPGYRQHTQFLFPSPKGAAQATLARRSLGDGQVGDARANGAA